jgi:hypothetical protein
MLTGKTIDESEVSEEKMEEVVQILAEKRISGEDQGAVIADFTRLLPGKEGKRLGGCLVKCVNTNVWAVQVNFGIERKMGLRFI